MQFLNTPFLKILVVFIPGLLLGLIFENEMFFESTFYPILACFLGLLLMLFGFFNKKKWCRLSNLNFLFAFIFGFLLTINHKTDKRSRNYLEIYEKGQIVEVKVNSIEHKNSIQITANVNKIGRIGNLNGEVLLFLNTRCDCPISLGDNLSLEADLIHAKGANTPFEFDYNKYLARKGIQRIAYLKCTNFQVLNHESIHGIELFVLKFQNFIKGHLDLVFQDSKLRGLMYGLLVGKTNLMASSQLEEYRSAGIGYMFAVSGMHVGLMYGIFSMLLIFLKLNRRLNLIRYILILTGIWLFIIAADLTASSVRAGAMLSLYETANLRYKQINKWNVLSLTALVSLIVKPMIIFDLGFQLSYMALVGIFLFYSKLNALVHVDIKILKSVKQLLALSFSAQLGILPLSLFYFHEFSPYFWLTGLICVFLTTLLIGLGLAYCLIFSIPLISDLFLFIMTKLQLLMDYTIELIMSLPYASLSFEPEVIVVLLIYSCIVLLAMVIYKMSYHKKVAVSFAILITCLVHFSLSQVQSKSMHLIVNSGQENGWYLSPGNLILDKKYATSQLQSTNGLFKFNNDSICVLTHNIDKIPIEATVIVANQAKFLKEHIGCFSGKIHTIVVNGLENYYDANKIMQYAAENNIQLLKSNGFINYKLK